MTQPPQDQTPACPTPSGPAPGRSQPSTAFSRAERRILFLNTLGSGPDPERHHTLSVGWAVVEDRRVSRSGEVLISRPGVLLGEQVMTGNAPDLERLREYGVSPLTAYHALMDVARQTEAGSSRGALPRFGGHDTPQARAFLAALSREAASEMIHQVAGTPVFPGIPPLGSTALPPLTDHADEDFDNLPVATFMRHARLIQAEDSRLTSVYRALFGRDLTCAPGTRAAAVATAEVHLTLVQRLRKAVAAYTPPQPA